HVVLGIELVDTLHRADIDTCTILHVDARFGDDRDTRHESGHSLALAMQIARCASSTDWRVASATPVSASAAALALSPACSSSMTAARSSSECVAFSAFLANSPTTAISTGDAP